MIRGSLPIPRRADGPAGLVRVVSPRLRGSISPAAVNSLAQAIQKQEGYYPGSIAYQNNNPGNLVYAGQPGASPGAGGFASFPSYSAGYQALENQITLDATRGTDVNGNPINTVSDLITSWAPPSENNTAAYIASVSASTGYDPNSPLSSLGDSGSYTPPAPFPITSASMVPALDLSGVTSALTAGVDLSSIGLSSSVPVYMIAGAALLALLLLRR